MIIDNKHKTAYAMEIMDVLSGTSGGAVTMKADCAPATQLNQRNRKVYNHEKG